MTSGPNVLSRVCGRLALLYLSELLLLWLFHAALPASVPENPSPGRLGPRGRGCGSQHFAPPPCSPWVPRGASLRVCSLPAQGGCSPSFSPCKRGDRGVAKEKQWTKVQAQISIPASATGPKAEPLLLPVSSSRKWL